MNNKQKIRLPKDRQMTVNNKRLAIHDHQLINNYKKALFSLSDDDKVNLFQCIEVDQGVRIMAEKSPDLSPNASRILSMYKRTPARKRRLYGNIIKKMLYNSIICVDDSALADTDSVKPVVHKKTVR